MPLNKASLTFSNGLVTSPEKSTLGPGELRRAVGCEYRIGTSEIHKQPGRSIANSVGLGTALLNIHTLNYDPSADVFVAAGTNGSVYEATPGTSMTFGAAALTGRSTSVVPQFTHFGNRWLMVNGVDVNKIREPNPINILSDHPSFPWPDGNWRNVGMARPNTPPTVVGTTVGTSIVSTFNTTPVSSAGASGSTSYFFDTSTGQKNPVTFPGIADTNDTSATACRSVIFALGQATTSMNIVFGLSSTALNGLTNRRLRVSHYASTTNGLNPPAGAQAIGAPASYTTADDHINGKVKVEVSVDSGVIWKQLSKLAAPYSKVLSYFDIPDSPSTISGNVLMVRFTTSIDSINSFGYLLSSLSDIRVDNNLAAVTTTTENDIVYGYTERYVDADGIWYESALSDPTTILAADFVNLKAVTIGFPPVAERANPHALTRIVYRSLDEVGGGYPNMWYIGEIPITATSFTDTFTFSMTSAADKDYPLEMLTIVAPTGETLLTSPNSPPPNAEVAVAFDGAIGYVGSGSRNRLYFSLPTSASPIGGEKVPEFYYMDFLTSRNDDLKTLALTNGGRSLIAYFESYSMLINFFPQATDPGTFDSRVREYVSDKRGSAGRLTACSFSPDEGVSTLAASVDALGLWVTDGVGMLKNSSKDILWDGTDEDGVPMPGNTTSNLGSAILVDNPQMRRLELIYDSDSAGAFKEMHFFYGSLKENGQPKITGPHPVGWRCKHYNLLTGRWHGWSGDKGSGGFVYNERAQDEDASDAYSSDGIVPFDVESGDVYPYGLGISGKLTMVYPKFKSGVANKEVTVSVTVDKDGDTQSYPLTKSKTFNTATGSKLLWLRYCDRFRVRVQDLTATSLASLVAADYTIQGLKGEGGSPK